MLESKIRTPPPAFFAVFYSFAYSFPIALTSVTIRKFSVSPLPHQSLEFSFLLVLLSPFINKEFTHEMIISFTRTIYAFSILVFVHVMFTDRPFLSHIRKNTKPRSLMRNRVSVISPCYPHAGH